VLGVVQQAIGIRRMWPGVAPKVKPTGLVWIGKLKPSAVSPAYTVKVVYRPSEYFPTVHVLDPPLDPRHRDRLPHVYDGDRLCLCEPEQWDQTMSIAETIIPWTAEWLFHYELWKATDRWSGGGDVYAPANPVSGQ
jgi:hypothetical protein